MKRLTPKAEGYLRGQIAAYEQAGAHEKAAEVEGDLARMRSLATTLNMNIRHESEAKGLKPRPGLRQCETCARTYQPLHLSQKYCSRPCHGIAHRKRLKERGWIAPGRRR